MKRGDYISRLSGLDQFSPPFPRGGQAALFGIEVFDVPGAPAQLNATVQHKNLGDTAWSTLGTFSGITTVGVKTLDVTGCKEMLRFKFSITLGGSPQVYDTFYIDVLAPTWMQ